MEEDMGVPHVFWKSHLFVCSGVGVHVEVRGQRAAFHPLRLYDPWERAPVSKLGGNPSTLSHLSDPQLIF